MLLTHTLEQQLIVVTALHFNREVILLHKIHLGRNALVHMQIIMHEDTIALIRMQGVGRNDIQIARTQPDQLARKMQQGLTLRYIIDAGEGRNNVLPVPVAVVVRLTNVEHLQVKRFYGYLHTIRIVR